MKNIYPWQKEDFLRLQALRNRPLHALVFKGAKGIGKFDLAINFAQSLLCQQFKDTELACGQCPSCHWFEQASHPDFKLLQPEILDVDKELSGSGKKPSKQISVDQIRGLADFAGMSAHQGGRRVVVIHPAESMNTNASNALLKSLEEPPQGMLFILVTQKPQQLLPTILSRCMSFAVSAPDTTCATQWLKEQGVKHSAEALAASGFAPLQAVLLDEQIGSEERGKLLNALRRPEGMDVFALAEVLQKTEQVLIVQWLQQWSYDLNAMKLAGQLRYHPSDEALIKKLVQPVAPLNLARLQKYLQTAKREAHHTLNQKLFFESMLLVYLQLILEKS